MKKRLLSIVLMLVMALSLVACGSKPATAKDVLVAMSKAEAGSSVCEFEFTYDDISVFVKFSAEQKDEQNGFVAVDAKISVPEYEYVMEEYVPFTEVYIVDGENVYINLGQIMDFFVELDSQFAMMEAYLGLTSDYLMISREDLLQLYANYGMDTSELDITIPADEEKELNDKKTDAMVDLFGDFINEFAANAGETAVTVMDNKVTFTMTKDNYSAIIDAFAAIDVEGYLMTFAQKLDEIEGGNENLTAFQEEIAGMNDEIKAGAEEAKESGVGEGFEQLVVDFGVSGKNVVITMNLSGKDSDDVEAAPITFNMTVTQTPEKADGITAPTEYMDLNEFIAIVNQLSGY